MSYKDQRRANSIICIIIALVNLFFTSCETRQQNPTPDLVASFTYSPATPVAGQPVQITDTSTGGPTSWQWNFGEGSSSTGQNPSITYTSAGSYGVTLTISRGSSSNVASRAITIGQANVITAASPSLADVRAAVSVAHAGDTIIIPAGTATWTSYLSITKSLSIIGAGMDQTIINNGYSMPSGGGSAEINKSLISFFPTNPEDNPPFRLSGITFNFGTSSYGILLSNATLYDCTSIRLDHLRISARDFVFQRSGLTHGCMDNCIIKGSMDMIGLSSYWTHVPYNYGERSNFYIEDCDWSADNNTTEIFQAGNGPMRYAFRYNTITIPTGVQISPLFDQHGNQSSAYSCMGAEIYENHIDLSGNNWTTLFYDQRGGKSLVYNNTITWSSSGGVATRVREEHQDSNNPPATHAITGQPQHISDSYYWGNRNNGAVLNPSVGESLICSTCGKVVPTENQDFWVEKTAFDGTTGVGVGRLADKPTRCTKGVAYWATDTKTLYRCTSTDVWTEYYKPYPYPHPLRAWMSANSAFGN